MSGPEPRSGPQRRARTLLEGIAHFASDSVHEYLDKAIRRLEESHAEHGVTSVFGAAPLSSHVATTVHGSRVTDVEAHTLAIVLAVDTPLHHKESAVTVLTSMRPLQPATINALMTFAETQLAHIDEHYDKVTCSLRVAATKPECTILSLARCRADAELECEWQMRLTAAIAKLLHTRVFSEAQSARRLLAADAGEEHPFTFSPLLSAAHARLHRLDTAAPAVAFVGHALHPRDSVIDPASFTLGVVPEGSEADSGRRGRVLQGTAASVTGGRQLSFRTQSGLAPSTLLYRARRLGFLTLLQFTFGQAFNWK